MADTLLRLRRRIDGSVLLVGPDRGPEGAVFPPIFTFSLAWLLGDVGRVIARVDAKTVSLVVANGQALYQITGRDQQGNLETELFRAAITEVPPVVADRKD
jgi:hypothetical protein